MMSPIKRYLNLHKKLSAACLPIHVLVNNVFINQSHAKKKIRITQGNSISRYVRTVSDLNEDTP
jgi:hypothetical protein